jgi:hypothetical protein
MAKNTSKIILLNQSPPLIPVISQAPSFLYAGEICQVMVHTSDPESDAIQYGIKWDIHAPVQWSDEWYSSNETCLFTHQYHAIGLHQISVKARDSHHAESDWSEVYPITVEDNHDPALEVISPGDGIYIKDIYRFPFFMPIVFGPITIQVNTTDESGIEKVLFYVDDMVHPKAEVLSPPYQFTFDEISFHTHKIMIRSYDIAGRSSEQEIKILKFF